MLDFRGIESPPMNNLVLRVVFISISQAEYILVEASFRNTYQDCQEEEEIPGELEPQEEEQPQTEVDLACASVQIVHTLLATDDTTPEPADPSIEIAGNKLLCPLELPPQPALGTLSLTNSTSERGRDTAAPSDLLTMARQCIKQWPTTWSSLLCQARPSDTIVVSPLKSPPQASLLYYPITIEQKETTAMLDTSASYSFITRMLVTKLKLTTTRLDASLTATDFGGARATISEMVTTVISLANASRKWSFYICAQAPAPCSLGTRCHPSLASFPEPNEQCTFTSPHLRNDAALPTADRGCSPRDKASSDEDYSSIVVWPALTSLTTSSYLLSERSEARIPAEEPVFFKDIAQPIEEAEHQLQTPRPYFLHDDSSGVTLYRCSSVTA